MTRNELLYGFDAPEPAQTLLQAGPLSLLYENGSIRYIKYGDIEIIRMLYIALRDKNWGTYTPIIENEIIESRELSFFITYTCRYEEQGTTLLTWKATIEGDTTGKIIFTINGVAAKSFQKNRAGFCLLHPIENTAGQPLKITYSNGSTENTFFPSAIAAQNPFSHITQLQWHNGEDYCIELKGESFEMEDHRNWTDTSFKTFCTPLSLPFPATIEKGDAIYQQLIFYPVAALSPVTPSTLADKISISITDPVKHAIPAIGIGASTEINELPQATISLLRLISPDHYTIELKLFSKDWEQKLQAGIRIASALQTVLFIAAECSDNYKEEFHDLSSLIKKHTNSISQVLVWQANEPMPSQAVIDWLVTYRETLFPGIAIGAGTATNFAELNRNLRNLQGIDFAAYTIHPQEHAFDNLSLIENLASQADTVLSAKQLYPGKSISIAAITLRRRRNPYAQQAIDKEWTNEQKADPRQPSLWAAGWMLGSIKYLAESGAGSITYYQTAGKQGICTVAGELSPTGTLLQLLATTKHALLQKTTCSNPLHYSSLLLTTAGNNYLFLANHTNKTIQVQLPFAVTKMDAIGLFPSVVYSSVISPTLSIELLPYAVIRVS